MKVNAERSEPTRPKDHFLLEWPNTQLCAQARCFQISNESKSFPIADHAKILVLAWTVLKFACMNLCSSLLKTMSYPIADHAEVLILAATVFDLNALSHAGACLIKL